MDGLIAILTSIHLRFFCESNFYDAIFKNIATKIQIIRIKNVVQWGAFESIDFQFKLSHTNPEGWDVKNVLFIKKASFTLLMTSKGSHVYRNMSLSSLW